MLATMLLVQPLWCSAAAGLNPIRRHVSKPMLRSGPGWSKIYCEMDKKNWIEENEALVRGAPIVIGAASMVAVVLNRALSGIPLVASASSSLSRADVLTVALAATVLLQGLVWKSVEPKPLIAVELEGVECMKTAAGLPNYVLEELEWLSYFHRYAGLIYIGIGKGEASRTWESLQATSRTRALVLVYKNACVLQAGVAAEESDGQPVSVDAAKLMGGSLCKEVTASGQQNYLANLALYPGRVELPFLPRNTQAVILQPIDQGVLIVASDTIRGFDPQDQGWIRVISQKLEATLDEFTEMQTQDQSAG